MKPVIMRMVVLLPAPLGPRKPSTSPFSTVKETPFTATFGPNSFFKFRTLIMSRDGKPAPLRGCGCRNDNADPRRVRRKNWRSVKRSPISIRLAAKLLTEKAAPTRQRPFGDRTVIFDCGAANHWGTRVHLPICLSRQDQREASSRQISQARRRTAEDFAHITPGVARVPRFRHRRSQPPCHLG